MCAGINGVSDRGAAIFFISMTMKTPAAALGLDFL